MRSRPRDDPRPLEPPDIDRRILVPAGRLVGIAVLTLVPVLAAVGVLDDRWATIDTAVGAVHATIEWPTQIKGKPTRPTTIAITNRSAATLDAIDVTFDRHYLDRFADVALMPMPRDAHTVTLSSLTPGETRGIRLEFTGGLIGRHHGTLTIRVADQSATVQLRTTVLP